MNKPWRLNWTQWHAGLAALSAAAAVAADLFAWSWGLTPQPGQLFLLSFFQSLLPLVAASALAHFLLYRPLKQIEAIEGDPLAHQLTVPYPQWALAPVRHMLAIYDDYRLHREAYTRLTEAYRASFHAAASEQRAKDPSETYRAAIDHKLAQSVTLYKISAPTFRAQIFAELKHPDADAPPKTSEPTEEDIAKATRNALSRGETEFVLGEDLFQIPSTDDSQGSELLLVRIKPRRLWSRLPKVYRRFFQMAGSQALSRESASPPDAAHPVQRDVPEISRILVLHTGSDGQISDQPLPSHVGYALGQAPGIFGDFLAIAHDARSSRTCVFLGDVPGRNLRSAFAVTGTMAVIAERLEDWHLYQPATFLESMAFAIHRYHSLLSPDGPGVTLTAIYFDHRTAEGLLASFGQPFPYLINPHDRRPLVVAPLQRTQGLLGTKDQPNFDATRFSVLSGQVLITCTQGLLSAKNENSRTFEKEIGRGKLATLFEDRRDWSAQDLANDILAIGKRHSASKEIMDDLTVVTLQAENNSDPSP